MLKCSRDRCVCAPQSLSAGTLTSPRLSVSVRKSAMLSPLRGLSLVCFLPHDQFRYRKRPPRYVSVNAAIALLLGDLDAKRGAGAIRLPPPSLRRGAARRRTSVVACDVLNLAAFAQYLHS